MLVVNLFGVPGAGKSTGAAFIFSKLKMAGINAELVTEFAKDKAWEENQEPFKPNNQIYLLGKQFYRMERCRDKVECLITDSPLVLNAFYNKSPMLGEPFNEVALRCFNSYKNVSYLLRRVKPYNPKGRLQTEAESDAMAEPLRKLLIECGVDFEEVSGCEPEYIKIAERVYTLLRNEHSDYLLGLSLEPSLVIENQTPMEEKEVCIGGTEHQLTLF